MATLCATLLGTYAGLEFGAVVGTAALAIMELGLDGMSAESRTALECERDLMIGGIVTGAVTGGELSAYAVTHDQMPRDPI